ncbi:hypothetical protein [Robertkochia flava]|uniref:hypothetical protein n=1 Tax=Robertkochia flava TaxID=3447986 RepID=UPI001CCAC504|nr:hypothetical protein [Robertkochia marina]
MKNLILFSSFACCLLSCAGKPKLKEAAFSPEIPLSTLNEKGIAAYRENYKSSYYDILPYLYYNEKGRFNGIQGDFYNLKFHPNSDLNVMPGFFGKIGKHRNALVVLISLSATSSLSLKDVPVSVSSLNHGEFSRSEELWGIAGVNKDQQRILFLKPLELQDKYDVLNKVKDDVITVTVDGEKYVFLNPEVHFEE